MKKIFVSILILFIILIGFYYNSEESYIILRVIDGDTIELNNGQKVRLIGVDTPEKFESKKLHKDSKKSGKSIEIIKEEGEFASKFTKKTAEGKKCKLVFDKYEKDRYNRILAYVVLEDGRILNEEIIKNGFGVAYVVFPFKQKEKYIALEKTARNNKVGLWK